MSIQLEDFKIEFHLRDDSELPALVTLFVGDFKIRGFTIRPSKFSNTEKRFVLYPPSNRSSGGKWIKIFWTDSKDLWKKLEEKVLKQFDDEHTEYLMQNSIDSQNNEIKVEDIEY